MPAPNFLGPFVDVYGGSAAVPPAESTMLSGATHRRLSLSMSHPRPTEWCWAAVASAVATYYATVHGAGEAMTPCEVATSCLESQCCPEPTDPNDPRNEEYALEGALRTVRHLAQDPVQGALDFEAIVAEIDGERPVCCHIAWDPDNPDNGHVNVIIGYDAANQDIDVSDSLYRDQTLPLAVFTKAYQGKGEWDCTYFTY